MDHPQISIVRERNSQPWTKYLPSITSVIITIYFISSLLLNGDVTPLVRRGFFCDDSTINYPIKTDTIDLKVLMLVGLVIPSLVIKCCDMQLIKLLSFSALPLSSDSDNLLRKRKQNIKRTFLIAASKFLKRPFGECQLFYFGFASTMFFTGLGKVTCGRMRPHFMQKCQPNVDCTLKQNRNRYIEDFNCTNTNLRSRDFSYITTSWPSGKFIVIKSLAMLGDV